MLKDLEILRTRQNLANRWCSKLRQAGAYHRGATPFWGQRVAPVSSRGCSRETGASADKDTAEPGAKMATRPRYAVLPEAG